MVTLNWPIVLQALIHKIENMHIHINIIPMVFIIIKDMVINLLLRTHMFGVPGLFMSLIFHHLEVAEGDLFMKTHGMKNM